MSVKTEEGWHTLPDKTQLYTKTWHPTSTPIAHILFIHGFSDHCNNYPYLFTHLANAGISTHGFDQRGWGRSVKKPSDKGASGPTSTVLADISSMLNPLLPSPVPVFIMGHSMGGAETLLYASQGPPELLRQVRGFIASAPLIDLHPSTRPWRATVLMGRLAGRLLPRMQLVNKLDSGFLSHDDVQNKAWEADELCHDTGTLQGLAGMLDRAEELNMGRVDVREGVGEGGKTRLLVLHGTADRINDFAASKAYVERCGLEDASLQTYQDLYHNLHAEIDDNKAKFAEDVTKWILDRLDSTPSQSKL